MYKDDFLALLLNGKAEQFYGVDDVPIKRSDGDEFYVQDVVGSIETDGPKVFFLPMQSVLPH